MNINLNNVRKQAVFAYGRLVKTLNDKMDSQGDIAVAAEDIQEDMQTLRQLIGAMAFSYMPGDNDFKDLSDEIGDIPVFNPEDEEKHLDFSRP
ncbi:MAG: hypothetical protein ACLP51_05785 [Syntrophobacteraceae bacterium]